MVRYTILGKGGKADNALRRQTSAIRRIQKAYRKSKARKRAGLNKVEKKQVKKIVASRKESKYCPNWYNYDNFATTGGFLQATLVSPKVVPAIFDATDRTGSFYMLQTGHYLNAVSTAVNAVIPSSTYQLGGFGMERGDSGRELDGDYAYLQSSQISLNICADTLDSNNGDVYNPISSPLEFRVIQFRAKKDASGTSPNLLKALFNDFSNDRQGLNSVGSVKELMYDWRVNRDQLLVDKEIRFKLNNVIKPSTNVPMSAQSALIATACGGAGARPSYPNMKQLTLWLEKPKKKLRLNSADDGSVNYFEPLNFDFVTYILILCCRSTEAGGTTDTNSSAWSVRASGMTKYKDM